MARETLKDFLSSIGSAADRIDYVRKPGPDGLGIDPNTNKELLDLVNETQGLVGDYLKHIVDNSSKKKEDSKKKVGLGPKILFKF